MSYPKGSKKLFHELDPERPRKIYKIHGNLVSKDTSDESDLTLKDYRHFIQNSNSQIACFAFEPGISVQQRPSRIVDALWASASRCIEANRSFAQARGYTVPQDVFGSSFASLFPPNQANFEMIRTWVEAGLNLSGYETAVEGPNGEHRILLYSMYTLTSDSLVKRAWITARDVTATRDQIKDLEEVERHFRTLVERPGLVLVRVRPDGRYVYISPYASSFNGSTIEQMTEDPAYFKNLIHPDDVEKHEKIWEARRSGSKEIVEIEYRVKSLSGEYHWFYERQIPKLDEYGNVEFYDSIALNIQRRKEHESDLIHSKRMESFGALAGGIAHDFNNHLAAILGQITLSLDELEPDDPGYSRMVAAERAALSAAEMAKTLLSFSRKQDANPLNPIDLSAVAKETIDLLRHLLPSTIEISLQTPDDPTYILGSLPKMQQVIMNLGVNARDAMPAGGTLTVHVDRIRIGGDSRPEYYSEAPDGNYIELSVSDTGTGIPDTYLLQIFDPFFTTKKASSGTGLGLSMVYSIVQSHQGWIHVDSEEGSGTQFRFIIPESFTKAPQKPDTEFSSTEGGNGEIILVADDDEMVMSMVSTALSMNGYQVVTAYNGEDALERFSEHGCAIALALIDLTMPRLSGREVIERIQETCPGTPVILTSGFTENEVMLPDYGSNVQFLGKPYPLPELLKSVGRLVKKHRKIGA